MFRVKQNKCLYPTRKIIHFLRSLPVLSWTYSSFNVSFQSGCYKTVLSNMLPKIYLIYLQYSPYIYSFCDLLQVLGARIWGVHQDWRTIRAQCKMVKTVDNIENRTTSWLDLVLVYLLFYSYTQIVDCECTIKLFYCHKVHHIYALPARTIYTLKLI